jgi:Protein of unknown function (DUF2804)
VDRRPASAATVYVAWLLRPIVPTPSRQTVPAYRGIFGQPRPQALAPLALPPARMPPRQGLRPLKAWRYVGVYAPELMLCIGAVRVGPLRQSFWAVWDRQAGQLHEHTAIGHRQVRLEPGSAQVIAPGVKIELRFEETAGVETVGATGNSYAWTRKQGGVHARGAIRLRGEQRPIDARAVIDDTAAYYERRTCWRWSAGVGRAEDGRRLAWNLVDGVNDPPTDSERTVWIEGDPHEVGPCSFARDLSGVDALRFEPEAVRQRRDNLLVLRSHYRQPFGTFLGALPGGIRLAEGYGVMEEHDARW